MGGKPKSQRSTPTDGWQPNAQVPELLDALETTWGHATCELDHKNAYELLVATILSAQSTDKRINQVTPALFGRYPNPTALASADLGEVETLIHSTGFYRNKAKNIVSMAIQVVAEHDGEIPNKMADLVALPGVARKTANVVLGTVFGIASGVVVDTHVHRLSRRLHLSAQDNPKKIEEDLMKVIPKSKWINFSHQLIWHGRRVCHARKPLCSECPLVPYCPEAIL